MGILHLENENKDFKLDQSRMVIGRRPGADIVLADPAVSGQHILVISILDDSFIENLSDTNGTFINGKRTENNDTKARENCPCCGDRITGKGHERCRGYCSHQGD